MAEDQINIEAVSEYLQGLQDKICAAIEEVDGEVKFDRRRLERERGGYARPHVMEGGKNIERAAVNFSHARGNSLPPAATATRPFLAGRAFQAVSTSLIVHPRNPYAPTSHANFRFFVATKEGEAPIWWFGGGFDLTPYYGFIEDAVHWHTQAKEACEPFGDHYYDKYKKECDDYFFLKHRGETRGIGGLFFDDFNELGFDKSFEMVRSIADRYLPAYIPILERRVGSEYGEAERQFQLYRRGRYVEFNLVYDRGTLYGLQSGGRIESILASMPPLVRWEYDFKPEAGTPEAELYQVFLKPQDWLTMSTSQS